MAKKQLSRIGASFMSLALAVTSTFCMGTFAASAANTDAQSSESGSAIAVLNNEAGWTTCNVYYWGSNGSSSNASWPGVTLTDADKNAEGFYEVEIDAQYLTETNGVIFNNGSSQSDDLDIAAGECKVYNNKTGTWEDYDSNALKLSLSTDVASPQYKETDIVLTATASGGSGSYTYTFKAGSTTIYTGSNSTCTWTPTTAGTYTLSVSVADTAGNSNSKSTTYEIKDDTNAEEPVLKGISTGYTDNKVPVNTAIPVNVNASGGKIGTNLLFYKVAVTDPSGNAVNTVYYKQSNILNFTPTTTGDYTVDVTVQNSYNKTVNKKYTVTVQTSTADPAPVISSFTASPTSTTVGTATTLKTVVKASTGKANFTYTYYANGTAIGTTSSSSRTNTYSWTPTTAGTYTLKVIVKDANAKTVSKSISNFAVAEKATEPPTSATEKPVISVFTTSTTTSAAGEAVTLKARVQGGTPNYTYTFTANGETVGAYKTSLTSKNATWTPTEAGTYALKVVVVDANGYTVSKTISSYVVTGTEDPSAPVLSTFTTSTTTSAAGEAVTLKARVQGGTPNYTYTFTANGETVGKYTTSSTSKNVTWTPTEAGTYTLKVVVVDANGYTVSKTISSYVVTSGDDYLLGDVNGDGKVSVVDAVYVSKVVTGLSDFTLESGTTAFKAADVDGNGKITIADSIAITRMYL